MTEIPEGYRYYRVDPANKAALDLIMSTDGLPPGLEIDEWPAYYQVRLAAERVRTDFYGFVHRLWLESWSKALADHLSGQQTVRSGGQEDLDPSLASVWTDRLLGDYVRLPNDSWLWAEVRFAHDRDLQLGFYVEDATGSYDWSDAVSLADPWLDPDDESWRRTQAQVVEPNAEVVDNKQLSAAAAEVVKKLALEHR